MVPLALALLLLVSISAAPDAPVHQQQFSQKGLEAEGQKEYEQALSIWMEAKIGLDQPSLGIGRNFIRVTTEQQMEKYYPSASAMYRWGLSGGDVGSQKEHVVQELQYMEPLLTDDERLQWHRMLEEDDPALLREMQLWWEERDPTPGTPYNERIVEHWQRIAYAKEHFTVNTGSVYGTDDRGVTWVKYGMPDRRLYERFLAVGGEASNTMMDMLTAWKGYVNGSQAELRAMSKAMENALIEMVGNPRYEIWIYDRENAGTDENVIRLFGELPGGGFSQLLALEDLMPNRAFTQTNEYEYRPLLASSTQAAPGQVQTLEQRLAGSITRTVTRIKPALLAQVMLYSNASAMDPVFAEVYNRIQRDVFSPYDGPPDRYYPRVLEQENRRKAIARRNREPLELPTHSREFPDIPLDIHHYRLLSDGNRPVYATFVESRPQEAFLLDLVYNQDTMLPDSAGIADTAAVYDAFSRYHLYHGVEIRGREGRLTGEWQQPTMMLDGNDVQVASSSVFTVPFINGPVTQVYYAELYNKNPGTRCRVKSPFPDGLRGVGKRDMEQPEPLDADPNRLQMGDLILGYGQEDSVAAGRFLPFTVSHDGRIPEGEALSVHIEVYHLQPGADGTSDFTINYRLLQENPGIIRWLDRYRSNTELTLNFQTETSRYTEDLEIRTRDLNPGNYRLQLVTTDRTGGQQVTREIEFEVVR